MWEVITSPINYDLEMEMKPMPSADIHKVSAETDENKLVEESSDEFAENPGGRQDEDTELVFVEV